MQLTKRQEDLLNDLKSLKKFLRNKSYETYRRINPFCEDLCDWKEKGFFWSKNKNVTIYDSATIAGDVEIGDGSWIGSFVALDGSGGLEIGKNCSISSGCQVLSHDTAAWAVSGGKMEYSYAKTVIGDNCFLGTYAVITKGVSLGNQSVVGAGAVVTKSTPTARRKSRLSAMGAVAELYSLPTNTAN